MATSNTIVKALGQSIVDLVFTDSFIIDEILKKGNVEALEKVMEIPDFTFDNDVLTRSGTKRMTNYLLKNVVDISKNSIQGKRAFVATFIISDVLKYPVDPNMIMNDGYILWHTLYTNLQSNDDGDKFIKYNGPNFTVPIDINAQNNAGDTFIHMYSVSSVFFTYKPDTSIKNKAGFDALTKRMAGGNNTSMLKEYVEKFEKKPVTLSTSNTSIENVTLNNDVIKENEKLRAQVAEYEARLSAIKKTLAPSSS